MHHSAKNAQRQAEPPKFSRLEEPLAAWSRDHGYSRRSIFGGSFLQLYRTIGLLRDSYTLLVKICFTSVYKQSSHAEFTIDVA